MNDSPWILLDTETTGLSAPVFTVELAAQRMRGWLPTGEPFRRLLNQNQDIPPKAARVHGYTREILERDGEPAAAVYRAFADYVAGLPLVAFNLEYDLDAVLLPEWRRLGIAPIGQRGFCALRLAQRLLDPVPAGNCKLQTLRQYYRLPERGAHTALGDVQTVADLCAQVLRPLAEQRGLQTWEQLVAFAAAEWFPSRIAFGKHKGRLVEEARHDGQLHGWLEWLAESNNPRNASMGEWYLRKLEDLEEAEAAVVVFGQPEPAATARRTPEARVASSAGLMLYVNPKLEHLRDLVDAARTRLAQVEVELACEKSRVEATQAALFSQLRGHYQRRDRLWLVVEYRKRFMDLLVKGGEEEAERVEVEFAEAEAESKADYNATAEAVAGRKALSDGEAEELGQLWKKLVRLYHPDRFAHEPEKLATFERLTAAINHARDTGDIALMREIANNPHGFITRQGWADLDFREEAELGKMHLLLETLELEVLSTLEALNQLRESADYELTRLAEREPGLLGKVIEAQAEVLKQESQKLEQEAAELAEEIARLTGTAPTRIS